MKKIYLLLILIAGFVSSCDSFLEEKTYGLVIPSTYPQSLAALDNCLNALYSINNAMYRETGVLAYAAAGDDLTTLPGGNKAGYLQFDIFTVQDNNDRIVMLWDNAYQAIKQANVIILSIDNIKQPDKAPEYVETQKSRALGQAHFIRALSYYNLVRIFGEVPIVSDLSVNYDRPKASFVDIYTQIESDLKKAEELLPINYQSATNTSDLEKSTYYARVTKGASKALLSSVYLTWAGYPLKDNSKYALAAQKAKEIIDNESSYGYRLLPTCADLWKWENGWKNVGNTEGVYTCFYNHTAGNWSDNGTNSNGNMVAPHGMFPSNFGGWDDMFSELTFYNDFPEGPRKDATFLTSGRKSASEEPITWENFAGKRPYYKKYMEIEGFDYENMGNYIDWWSSRTMQAMRYAEVLLIYAEAQAMAEGTPSTLAYTCLDRVRTRAGLDKAPAGLSGTAFRDQVINERKWEFAGGEPCARWHDMVRPETVAASIARRDASEIPLVGKPNDQTHEFYFSPVPQKDKMLNPNL